MRRLEAILLFNGQPKLALTEFAQALPHRVGRYGHVFTKLAGSGTRELNFESTGMKLHVEAVDGGFQDPKMVEALDGPLAANKRSELAETLGNQHKHIKAVLDVEEDGLRDWEHVHVLFHAITMFLAEWHTPAAVYWANSEQLVSGTTYLRLANRKTPWPLWLKTKASQADDDLDLEPGYHVIGAETFLGRPLFLEEFDGDEDQARDLATGFVMQQSRAEGIVMKNGIAHIDDMTAVDVIIDEPDDTFPKGLITLIRREDQDNKARPHSSETGDLSDFDASDAINSIVRESESAFSGVKRFFVTSFFAIAAGALTVAYLNNESPANAFAFDLENARIFDLSTETR